MTETPVEFDTDANPHLHESIPHEWKTWEVGGERVIAHDAPEGAVRLYRVVGASRIVRTYASADAALYQGHVVETHYDDSTKSIVFVHEYAGRKGSHRVNEYLEHPALRLEKLSPIDRQNLLS